MLEVCIISSSYATQLIMCFSFVGCSSVPPKEILKMKEATGIAVGM